MQKNWYIIYTKPRCEKKVVATLSKKKIESFFPVNCKRVNYLRKSKLLYEPLFNSYVFANISESEMAKIKLIDGVINFVFWRGQPAIVQNNDIDAIREFTREYHDIRMEKTAINLDGAVRIVGKPKYSVEGNLVTVKNTKVKINLRSLGFTLIAEIIPEDDVLNREVAFRNTELRLQS